MLSSMIKSVNPIIFVITVWIWVSWWSAIKSINAEMRLHLLKWLCCPCSNTSKHSMTLCNMQRGQFRGGHKKKQEMNVHLFILRLWTELRTNINEFSFNLFELNFEPVLVKYKQHWPKYKRKSFPAQVDFSTPNHLLLYIFLQRICLWIGCNN